MTSIRWDLNPTHSYGGIRSKFRVDPSSNRLTVSGSYEDLSRLKVALDNRGRIKDDGRLEFLPSAAERVDDASVACWALVFSGNVTLLGTADGKLLLLRCEHNGVCEALQALGLHAEPNADRVLGLSAEDLTDRIMSSRHQAMRTLMQSIPAQL